VIHEAQDQNLQEELGAVPVGAEVRPGEARKKVKAPPSGDEWVAGAVQAAEASVTKLLDEFRVQPFIHRVEHSVHVRLVQLLSEWEHLRGLYPIGGSGFRTQLIHKEWPEARPRKKEGEPLADGRRGSFDLVVLAPSQLQEATLEQFKAGRLDAPIVIELGLGYGPVHLQGDLDKLMNSAVQHRYLVHLSRTPSGHQGRTERIIADINAPTRIAYMRHDLERKKVRFRYLGSPHITEAEYSLR
jgi:hypothetical protein